ncbi:MAG: ABC transporter permease [Bdellovibrionaceae bacterium]|nr:ABC transporter permease [Pseudobdellovibrionaceae bacterium]
MQAATQDPSPQYSSKDLASAEHAQSFWKIVWEQFITHKAALIGLFIITLFILIALLAPVIAMVTGQNPEVQNPMNRYAKPMTEATLSADQRENAVTRFQELNPEPSAQIRKEIAEKQLFTFVREEDALYDLANAEPDVQKEVFAKLESPGHLELKQTFDQFSRFHLFGTDELGRDVFIRLVYGTRVSIGVGILVALASAVIGLLIGAMAGYYGGWVDTLLMRVTDALLSLPTLPVLIVVSAVSVDKVPGLRSIITQSNENIMKLVFILVLFSWMTVARLVRAEVLSLKEREFVLAAKTLGARDRTILFKHLFPNVIAPLLVSVSLGIGESIQFEAALSFLGLGIQQPTASWGNMLFNAQDLITEAPFLAILPGILILIITICFNYLGDGLQDAINPKSIRR